MRRKKRFMMMQLSSILVLLHIATLVLPRETIQLTEFERPEGASYRYSVRDIAFSDVDGSGNQKLVVLETGHEYPILLIATISLLKDQKRELEWESSRLWFVDKMLIGDIDGDKIDEILFYGPRFDNYSIADKTLRVIQWDGSNFVDEGFLLSGSLGTLADVDGDGKKELVLTVVTERLGDSEGLDPVSLKIYDFKGSTFELIYDFPLDHAITALNSGDLDGDGIDEIIAEENSLNGDIFSQISVFKVVVGGGLQKLTSLNHALPKSESTGRIGLNALTVVNSDDCQYLYVNFGAERKQRMYSLEGSESTDYKLILKKDLSLINAIDGLKSTLDFNEDINKFYILKGTSLEFYSENEIGQIK